MIDVAYYKKLNHEFHVKTGIIACCDRLAELGIEPPDVVGSFRSDRIEELLEFCKSNHDFHIVTHIDPSRSVNKFVRGDFIFNLADGDDDSSLELTFPPEVADHFFAELAHFVRVRGIGF